METRGGEVSNAGTTSELEQKQVRVLEWRKGLGMSGCSLGGAHNQANTHPDTHTLKTCT